MIVNVRLRRRLGNNVARCITLCLLHDAGFRAGRRSRGSLHICLHIFWSGIGRFWRVRSNFAAARPARFGCVCLLPNLVGGLGRSAKRVFKTRNGTLDQCFDCHHVLFVLGRADHHRLAVAPGPARAADAVHVILGMRRNIIVEHVADCRHIQTARGNIRGHENPQIARTEAVKRACPLALLQIAVNGGRVIAMRLERFRHGIHVDLAIAKDDGVGAFVAFSIDHHAQDLALFAGLAVAARAFEHDDALFYRLAGGCLTRHFDSLGRAEEGIRDPLDLGCHRGREKQRLAGERRQAENPLDIRDEPHVEHPVRLVHHHDLNAGQKQLAPLEMVQKAAGRCDQNVDTLVDQLVLLLEADAADQKGLGQFQVLGIGVEILGHLRGQFARGAQHQTARHARPRPPPREKRQHRQDEPCCFASPRLRYPQHVAARQRGGNRPLLNRGGAGISCFFDGLQNLGVQIQIGKFCHVYPWFTDATWPVRLIGSGPL